MFRPGMDRHMRLGQDDHAGYAMRRKRVDFNIHYGKVTTLRSG